MPRAPVLHRLVTRVPAEYADAVSEVLALAGATAVEEVPGRGGVVVRTHGARADLAVMAAAVRALFSEVGLMGRIHVEAAREAAGSWGAPLHGSLEPVRVSKTLVIAPVRPGSPAAVRGGPRGVGPRVVRLVPAFAFGHGEHPTTIMASGAVERAAEARVSAALDVGTGTGVLAIVAACAGVGRVLGVDVDPRAVAAARANARENGVSGRCRFSGTRIGRVPGRFPLVVANLDYRLHFELAPAIAARLSSGRSPGLLLVTGFLREHVRDIAGLYAGLGLARTCRAATRDGWALLSLRAVRGGML